MHSESYSSRGTIELWKDYCKECTVAIKSQVEGSLSQGLHRVDTWISIENHHFERFRVSIRNNSKRDNLEICMKGAHIVCKE
jgi:hypothetical protein